MPAGPASGLLRRVVRRRFVVAAFVAIGCVAALDGTSAPAGVAHHRVSATAPTLAQEVGQLLLVRMEGTRPSAAFLARVRRGAIGGVVIFGDNFGAAGPRALIATLQRAARQGGRPPLLIAVDQEGGTVKRLPGAPSLAPSQMRTPAIAEAQGLATAANLKGYGFNVDLAPVLDVGHGGFIAPRTFGTTPSAVAGRGTAFAAGLAGGGIAATAKHFPGLGRATLNTDSATETVHATGAELTADLAPFRAAIDQGVPLMLLSTAVYPALDSRLPAACSPAVVQQLLRQVLGYDGVVITDALKTPAITHFFLPSEAAVRAVAAGADMVLALGGTPDAANTDGVSVATHDALLAAVRSGRLKQSTVAAAYGRVLALKQSL